MTTATDINPSRLARITGALYFSIIPLGIFSIMYVPKQIFIYGDASATMANLSALEPLFRLGILGAIILQIINIFIALYLYKLLKPVNRNQAFMMVLLFVVSVPITIFNELNHLAVLLINKNPEYLQSFSNEQIQGMIFLFNDLHKFGIKLATFFWGLWLLPMGLLIYKSTFLPKILGVLLIIGCFGYMFDLVSYFLLPELSLPSISVFTSLGELLLPLWLMVRGVNDSKWFEVYQSTAEASR